MKEMKKGWIHLLIYYALIALEIPFLTDIVPDRFPYFNISSLYLCALCICLIQYYAYRVTSRIKLRRPVMAIPWLLFFLMLARTVKYSVVSEWTGLARFTWYLYYMPLLLLPLFSMYISLYILESETWQPPRRWLFMPIVTVALILLVLTNDLHQQVFRFQPAFAAWDSDYSYGWGFYALTAWQYGLHLASIILLVFKCRISNAKKQAWLVLIPYLAGTALMLLCIMGKLPKINGINIIQFPEAYGITIAGVWEFCMQLGLIPTNESHGRIFRLSGISAQITDRHGKQIYKSDTASDLTEAQVSAESGSRIDAHTILHKIELPGAGGGYGFWQDDVTELDRLNLELEESGKNLSEEIELIRLQNELREKQAKIEHRMAVYDAIMMRTSRQSMTISRIAGEARRSSDPAGMDAAKKHIALVSTYIKRYANLMLLSAGSDRIESGELALSVAELLRRLNLYGIPGEMMNLASGEIPAEAALTVFECLEVLVEMHLSSISGVFIHMSNGKDGLIFKINLENALAAVPDDLMRRLSSQRVSAHVQYEDEVTYISFILAEGGERP